MEIRLNWTAIFALGAPLASLAFLLVWLFLRLARWQIPHDKNILTAVGIGSSGQAEGEAQRAWASQDVSRTASDLDRHSASRITADLPRPM